MKSQKNSLIIYHDLASQTAFMTDAQLGQLLRAMLCFSMGGEPEFKDKMVELAFSFVRPAMERDKAKYEETCEKRQEAGRKGGRPRKHVTAPGAEYPTATKSGGFSAQNQKVSEKADNENDNENDNDNVRLRVDVLDVLDAQDSDDDAPVENPVENNSDCDGDFSDALAYAEKVGYKFTANQRKKLRQWCSLFPFDVVALAIDRAIYYQAKAVSYIFCVLEEWRANNLHDVDAVNAYISARAEVEERSAG